METVHDTPMMRQYWTEKSKHKEHLLLFRLGDFFEFFFDDAVIASKLLGITLTKRNDIPMCGVPAYAIESYIRKLLALGKKVAVCDQVKPVQKGELVEREVVEIITPGTIANAIYLDSSESNYLMAITIQDKMLQSAWVDISTGELYCEQTMYSPNALRSILGKCRPKEVLIPDSLREHDEYYEIFQEYAAIYVTRQADWYFSVEEGEYELKKILHVITLKSYGFEGENRLLLMPIAGVLQYIRNNNRYALARLHAIKVYNSNESMELDADAIYNLELLHSMRDYEKQYSLYGILDRCVTKMGSRLLQQWITKPSQDIHEIISRQKCVNFFLEQPDVKQYLLQQLRDIGDIPRLLTRILMNKSHPKDVYTIQVSATAAVNIFKRIKTSEKGMQIFSQFLRDININGIDEIIHLLTSALEENPPIHFGDEHVIKTGYDATLDNFRKLHENTHEVLDSYLQKEQFAIAHNLRLKYNKSVGYFFGVSHSLRGKLPNHFILRQTLTNHDRYKTVELTEVEASILSAEQQSLECEEALYQTLIKTLKKHIPLLNTVGQIIAELDVFVSFALSAQDYGYVLPEMQETSLLYIDEGRHPVIERYMTQGEFVVNGLSLDNEDCTFVMLTGPNMAGKSTYLRQNALIVIMAQIGSFVPAKRAIIGIRDKVFCRVGASDNLVRGESTFLVEMSETAYILQNITERSLVIMDEIGRGTSVNEGEAIAHAVSEYFLSHKIFTLFATHYHNLTDISFDNMKNNTLSTEKRDEHIVFTRKIIDGATKSSYGIEVAQLAGIPIPIITRARALLNSHTHCISDSTKSEVMDMSNTPDNSTNTITNMRTLKEQEILDTFTKTDLNAITPLQALQLLTDFKDMLRS